MLFRSSIALLLVFSFASINASPFDRRAPESPSSETLKTLGEQDSLKFAAALKAAPDNNGVKFGKVIECAIKEMNKPAVPLQAGSGAAGQNEPTPAVIAFDKCAKEIYASPAAPPPTASGPPAGSKA
ncbi:unnamed protein product [Absidia cylindrospora]